jgi:IS30 family transposase
MNDGIIQPQIVTLLYRYRSTINRNLARNTGFKRYRPKQALLFAEERSLGSRNAAPINPKDWDKMAVCLQKKWNPEQIADQVGISHETIYPHVYADTVAIGSLWEQLCCQKKRKKPYTSCNVRRGQIVCRRLISERSEHIEASSKIGHWEGDTVICAAHKDANVTLVECKSGCAYIAKASNKASDQVSQVIITKLNPVTLFVKTLTFHNRKEFA